MIYFQNWSRTNSNLNNHRNASETLRLGPGTALRVGRLVIYIWRALSASEVLAVAIGCIA